MLSLRSQRACDQRRQNAKQENVDFFHGSSPKVEAPKDSAFWQVPSSELSETLFPVLVRKYATGAVFRRSAPNSVAHRSVSGGKARTRKPARICRIDSEQIICPECGVRLVIVIRVFCAGVGV